MVERPTAANRSLGTIGRIAAAAILLSLIAVGAACASETRFDDLVSIETVVGRDSVRVGERLPVRFTLRFPDSLTFEPVNALPEGDFVPRSVSWSDAVDRNGTLSVTGRIVISTLNLEQAVLPPVTLRFTTAAGDTVTGQTREVRVPVRHVAAADSELDPLKAQWVAPRSWLLPGLALLALLLAVAALVVWRRWRSKRHTIAPVRPALPPDVAAFRALAEIERSELLETGRFKEYYSRVVDVLRRYIEARFGVEAMDRTTDELLAALAGAGVESGGLEELLREADLVKFAKYAPGVEPGRLLLRSVRGYVSRTTPAPVEESAPREAVEG